MGLGPKAQKEVLRLDIHGVQATAENVSMQARHINNLNEPTKTDESRTKDTT